MQTSIIVRQRPQVVGRPHAPCSRRAAPGWSDRRRLTSVAAQTCVDACDQEGPADSRQQVAVPRTAKQPRQERQPVHLQNQLPARQQAGQQGWRPQAQRQQLPSEPQQLRQRAQLQQQQQQAQRLPGNQQQAQQRLPEQQQQAQQQLPEQQQQAQRQLPGQQQQAKQQLPEQQQQAQRPQQAEQRQPAGQLRQQPQPRQAQQVWQAQGQQERQRQPLARQLHGQQVRRPAQGGQSQPQGRQAQAQQRQGHLVVVEGVNDMRAVQRAAPGTSVYVLGTSTAAGNTRLLQDLAAAASQFRGVIILSDPDVAGRQARRLLDEQLPGCLHAFLPSPLATAGAATKYHEEGNVGVEHAAPEHIRAALSTPRRSDSQRQLFSREQLMGWGLVQDLHARGGQVTARRFLVGAYLGLGDCDGKQLQRQLNRYCFSEEEVAAALRWAEALLAEAGAGSGGRPG